MGAPRHYLLVGTNGEWPKLPDCLQCVAESWSATHRVCSLPAEYTVVPATWNSVKTIWMWNAAKQWNHMLQQVEAEASARLTFLWLRHGATPQSLEPMLRLAPETTARIQLIEHDAGLLVRGARDAFAQLPPPQVGGGFFDEHVGNAHLLVNIQSRAAQAGLSVQAATRPTPQWFVPGTKRRVLSACMITKNGAAYLAQCLESLAGIADEVNVVLDSSTNDDTAAIAASYGVRLIERQWDGSFANARNVSMRAAQGQWVMFVDTDEALQPGAGPALRKLLDSQPKSLLALPVYNYYAEGEATGARSWQRRLAPNQKGISFVGSVHETLTGPEKLPVGSTNLTLYHYGYLGELSRTKSTRNEAYLQTEWQEKQGDPRLAWYLAGTYLQRHEYQPALHVIDTVPPGNSHWHLMVLYLKAEIYHQLGRSEDALDVLDRLLGYGISFPPAHALCGHVFLKQRRIDRAQEAYQFALSASWDHEFWQSHAVVRQDHEAETYTGWGMAFFHQGNFVEAERLIRHALSVAPSSSMSHRAMADVLVARGQVPEALAHLEQARVRATPGILSVIALEMARLYVGMGDPHRARHSLQGLPGNRQVTTLLARAAELEGDWSRARDLWSQLLTAHEDPRHSAHRAVCSVRLHDFSAAMQDLEQVMPGGEIKTPYAYVAMAMLAEATGNYAEAYHYLREAYQAGEGEVDVLLFFARMAYAAGATGDARDAAAAVLSVMPGQAEAEQIYRLTV